MTTATTTIPPVVICEARFVGNVAVNKAPVFLAPVSAFKPANPYPIKIQVSWLGDREHTLAIGRTYRIAVDTKAWSTSEVMG